MIAGLTVTTLRQSNNSPSGKYTLTREVKSNVKSLIITFFDNKGIVHKEFVPTGQTVNSRFCCEDSGDYVKMCKDVTPNFGENRPGCFIMIMHPLKRSTSPSSF
jgi:hypothetical protein